jgi:acyl carrier protein
MATIEEQDDVAKLATLIRQVTVDLPQAKEINENTRFVEDIGMESINRIMLITFVEQEFDVSLEKHMNKLVDLHTVGDTAKFIRALKGAR